jgi:hypothetical protein
LPTHEEAARFLKDYARLSQYQRAAFKEAVRAFVADLQQGRFRAGLRVKAMEGHPGVWEMTWGPDGRATFEFGRRQLPGETHIIWRRIGTHDIFRSP